MASFLEFWLFFPAVFCTEQLNCSCRFIFGIFLEKKFFDPNCPFCMGYRLTKMVDFQNGLISRISAVFFQRFFAQNNLIVLVDLFSAYFRRKKFLTQTAHFAWTRNLPKWSIFKMVSFLEYWLFFPAVFCTEQLKIFFSLTFGIFLEKKIFDPNSPFCMGYTLTKMVDFQNGLISRILNAFCRRFSHRTT